MNYEVIVNLSNRHIHLSEEDVEILFGKGHKLKNIKDLMQKGQFACDETVSIAGSKGKIENVRVLGPTRKQTQIEIMQSDAFKLGKTIPPVRDSGNLQNSLPVEIIGPVGKVYKTEGLIIASRHIHLDPETANNWSLKDKQSVDLFVGANTKDITFHNVLIRIHETFVPECHLDFDEGNAAGIGNGVIGLIKITK